MLDTKTYSKKIYTLDEIKNIVSPIAEKYNISKAWVFGSYARGEATPISDVDLRITIGDGCEQPFGYFGLFVDLEDAINKSVDVVSSEALMDFSNLSEKELMLRRELIREIKNDEVKIYERKNNI